MLVTRGKARLEAQIAVLEAQNEHLKSQLAAAQTTIDELKKRQAGKPAEELRQSSVHTGVDLRATVALTVVMTVMTATLKDSIQLLPQWAALSVGSLTVASLVALGICLYASSKGLAGKPISDERRAELMMGIGSRKRISWNLALGIMITQGSVYAIGVIT